MKDLKVFDPSVCCSSAVPGVDLDPRLEQLASDLHDIKDRGVKVWRFNLLDDPQAFTDHPAVLAEMGSEGQFLPIFVVDGEIVSRGTYPARDKLAGWVGLAGQ